MAIFLATYQSQSKHRRLVLQKETFFLKKKLYGLMVSTVSRLQSHYEETLTFYHLVPRSIWHSFHQPRNNERLSQSWSYSVVFNPRLLDWESSTLTTRSLLQIWIQKFSVRTLIIYLAKLWDTTSFQGSRRPLVHLR